MKNGSHRETLGSHEAAQVTLVTCPEREERGGHVWEGNMGRHMDGGEEYG